MGPHNCARRTHEQWNGGFDDRITRPDLMAPGLRVHELGSEKRARKKTPDVERSFARHWILLMAPPPGAKVPDSGAIEIGFWKLASALPRSVTHANWKWSSQRRFHTRLTTDYVLHTPPVAWMSHSVAFWTFSLVIVSRLQIDSRRCFSVPYSDD